MLDLIAIAKRFQFPGIEMSKYKSVLDKKGITWLACVGFEQWLRQPVLFEPTQTMSEEMGQVLVTLKPEELQLSYPSICIKQTTKNGDSIYSLVSDVNVEGHRVLIICHSKQVDDAIGGQYSFTMSLDGNGQFKNGEKGETIEEIIQHNQDDLPPNQRESWELNRVAINTCLLLASHPTMRERSQRQKEWLKASKGRDRTKAVAAREKLKLQPQLIRFVNDPILTRPAKSGEATGRTVDTHWRKGHWRMQPYGFKSTLRRATFIQRILVHAELAENDANEIHIVGADVRFDEHHPAIDNTELNDALDSLCK